MPAYNTEQYSPGSDAVVRRLEQKYADRGLLFTTPFLGCVPVQAFGHVDGERFYFRFRSNHGSLRVGPYDREVEELYALRVNEDKAVRRQQRIEKARAENRPEEDEWDFITDREEKVVEENASDFFPTIITASASKEGADPEDFYNGSLTDDEAYDMFSFLLENLEPVPADKQLNAWTRVWLYEGRAAANALTPDRS